jgi:hypothetical protein
VKGDQRAVGIAREALLDRPLHLLKLGAVHGG